jgi:hypothetical protein
MQSDQLRNFLQEQTKKLSAEVVQTGGNISEDQVKALERLVKVAEISEKMKPPKARKRWPVAVMLLVTLVVVTLALVLRMPTTGIELELHVTEVRFTLANPVVLIDKMVLTTLGVPQLQEVQLPRARSLQGQPIVQKAIAAPDTSGTPFRVLAIQDAASPGAITLMSLLLPAGTKVMLRGSEIPDQYRLSLDVPKEDRILLQVSLEGTVEMNFPQAPEGQIVYSSPKLLQLQTVSNQADLDLTLSKGASAMFALYFQAQNLSFFRIEEFQSTTGSYVRQISTVQSGKVVFAEIEDKNQKGREYPIRIGEGLRFRKSDGQMRLLKIENNQLTLQFHGNVQGMITGGVEHPENLMPSVLEWLKAQHAIPLLWGTTLLLFGLVDRVIRWWKG